jgi:lysosomal alpha-mannosidase
MLGLLFLLSLAASEKAVFLAPHSHCDAGWITTFERYYEKRVRDILNTVTDVLWSNASSVFNWAEIGFLNRWWQDGDTTRHARFTQLVAQGRIVFAGGGWVQHDEACTHYRSAINQMTEGHRWIADHFGTAALPVFGWQIDPFGHASSTPIFFAQMGFSATVTDRVNVPETMRRIENDEMEFVWQSPEPWSRRGGELDIFGHQLGLALYMLPGFEWEGNGGSAPVTLRNLAKYKLLYEATIDVRALAYYTHNLLVPWGSDFMFSNATEEFSNMDKIVATQPDTRYEVIAEYFRALHGMNLTWPTYHGDFFPYYQPDTVWTGFYTSRAALKGASRRVDCLIETADAFLALSGSSPHLLAMMREARGYSGILCHHDAITGTARDAVVEDYFAMIANATHLANTVLEQSASKLTNSTLSIEPLSGNGTIVIATTSAPVRTVRVAQTLSGSGSSSSGVSCEVSPLNGATWVALAEPTLRFSLTAVTLPACSVNVSVAHPTKSFSAANAVFELQFGPDQFLTSIVDKRAGLKRTLRHSIARYWELDGSVYLFRADPAGSREIWGSVVSMVSVGVLVTEVRQVLVGPNNMSWTWRLFEDTMEVEYDVQLLQSGFSYIVRYDTEVQSGSTFFTDDQGYRVMQRTFNSSNRVELSYFPGVEHVYVQDGSGSRFDVVMSQSNGVTSSASGRLEIMIFRRLLNSGIPPEGMGQALNDTTPSQQTHRLSFDSDVTQSRILMSNPPVTLFAATAPKSYCAAIPAAFPLHVLSLKPAGPFVMLRLQNWDMQHDVAFDVRSLFGITNSTEYGLSFGASYAATAESRFLFNNGRTPPRNSSVVEAGMIRSYAVII